MSIESIKIKNLLSFEELYIREFKDINCLIGINNSGKSNLLKLIRFFYSRLDGKRELPPTLYSKYSTYGSITITYNFSRIIRIVTYSGNRNKSDFFKHIYNVLVKNGVSANTSTFDLTLNINSDDSSKWASKDKDILNIINYLFPFFDIDTRHIDLHDWQKLWVILSKLKSFNIKNIDKKKIVEFFDENLSPASNAYEDYINKINEITKTGKYSYREKVLNYVKAGLDGQTFLIDNKTLETQSDGTNSHRFLEITLESLITLSRRDYISPIIFIDEPEIGLHPKKNEELINKLFEIYNKYKNIKGIKEKGKYKTPSPKVFFATHSPNIVKEVIRLFEVNQQILHFSKNKNSDKTLVSKMRSTYSDSRFLNIFSDNEARLFFSNFILFVEGETELEVFGHRKLKEIFSILKYIDIYKASSNVHIENMNPSYSNASIPYLILFDADKIFKVKRPKDKTKKEIVLNNNGNLYKLREEVNKLLKNKIYFHDHNKRHIQKLISKIDKFIKNTYEFDDFTFKLKTAEFENFIQQLNSYLLNTKNIYFVKTTIEEVFINHNSKVLFIEWMLHEYGFDVNDFIQQNKAFLMDEETLIDYIRIFFGGKFETHIDYSLLEQDIDRTKKSKQLFELLKKKIPVHTKTEGWITSFLNFSLNKVLITVEANGIMDERDKQETIKQEIKTSFPELYDIIQIIEKALK